MEIQLIHIHDSYKETDIMKALKQRNNKTDTLAILSVLVELQKSDNTKLDSLFNATQNVKAMNDTQEFKGIRLGVIFNQTYSFEMACWHVQIRIFGAFAQICYQLFLWV